MKLILSALLLLNATSVLATDLPTDHDRKSLVTRFSTLPIEPSNIEFVRDGVPNIELMSQFLDHATITWVLYENLQWLTIRDMTVDREHIVRLPEGGHIIPVILSVRYEKQKVTIDGTINALFSVSTQEESPDVQLVSYSNNAQGQALGATVWGLQSGKSMHTFIKQIAGQTLSRLLENEETFESLRKIAENPNTPTPTHIEL